MRAVTGCPCGLTHRMSDQNWRRFREVERAKGATTLFGNVRGCWRIPRIYLACHPVDASNVRALAEQYGWPEAT